MSILWPNGGTTEPKMPGTASSGFRSSGEYGMRWHPVTGGYKLHAGIDLVGIVDGVIRAPFAGVVTISAYSGGYGNLIEITAPNGDRVRLAHNSRLLVGRGARVAQGDRVAIWGTTGSSTGVHCHFEFIPARQSAVNPRPVLNAANAAKPAGGGGSTPTPAPKRKRKQMSTGVIHTIGTKDDKRRGAIVNTESGAVSRFGWFSVAYANGVAKGFGLEASGPVSDGQYDAIMRDMAALAARNGKIAVDIDDRDVPKIGQ